MISTNYSINYASQLVPELIPAVQGDTGRTLIFTPADFTLPAGVTATYYVQKPSGEAVYNTATISDGKITCALTAQALAEVGENKLQVRVLKGAEVVTSFTAVLIVHPFEGIGAVQSTTEINIFDQAVEEAKEEINATIESAETALAEAVEEAIIEVHENALAFYVTDESSGSIATFPDGADLVPVKGLTVDVEAVQSGSGDPSPSNVRPISGWSQANVTRTGKNLLPLPEARTENGVTLTRNNDGTITLTGEATNNTYFDFTDDFDSTILSGYVFSGFPEGFDGNQSTICIRISTSDDRSSLQDITSASSKSIVNNGKNLRFAIRVSSWYTIPSGGITFAPMLRASTESADFAPYQGQTYEIDLDGTRYGGTLDVTSGVLTVDKAYHAVSNADTTRLFSATLTSGVSRIGIVVNDMKPPTWNVSAEELDVMCNIMTPDTAPIHNASASTIGQCCLYKDGSYNLFVAAIPTAANADAAKAWLVSNGCEFVYRLATPLTVQLTAEQVTTLLGTNNIFADCGDVSCEYRADTKLYIEKILNA